MKFKSALLTAGSGSVGGMTISHNRSGMYARARVIPVNTTSPEQQAVRGALATLAGRWNSTLTQDQRDAWNLYASLSPIVNTLGDSITISGLNMYVRSNAQRMAAGAAAQDDAPTTFGIGDAPQIVNFTATEALQQFDTDGTIGAPTAAGDRIHIFVSRPQNPGIEFFAGPYRWVLADAPTAAPAPAWSAAANAVPFPIVEGQSLFIRATCLRLDGRYSGAGTARTIVAA